MQLKINGEHKRFTPALLNLEQVLNALGYLKSDSSRFVVAYNQQLISAEEYLKTVVYDGDSVDVLSVITGG